MTGRPASDAEVPSSSAGPASRVGRAPWVRPRIHLLLPLTVYFLLVLFGVTTSSIGVDSLREDPQNPAGIQLMGSSAIRSDEYNTGSPLWLGQIAIGPGQSVNPLSVSSDFFAQLPDGPVSKVVFFEGSLLYLGPWLPDAMLFAAKWWLPTLMLSLGVPVWFRQVTGSMRWGVLCGLLIFLSPASAWWSWLPVNILGFVFAGCALGIWAIDELEKRRWVPGVAALILAGIVLARFPSFYQPYDVVVGFPPVLATLAYLLVRGGRWRRKLLGAAALGVSGAAWTGALLLEVLPVVSVGLHTVYPGARSESGGAVSLGHVFGATNLAWLNTVGTGDLTNPSEVSTSFTVLFLVLAILAVAQRWRGTRPAGAALWAMVVPGLFWLSWCTMSWGHLGDYLPVIKWVPPGRASNVVGFIALMAFCMFMTQWRRPSRPIVAVIAAVVAGWVSAYAGSLLQGGLIPGIGSAQIWFAAAITAGVVGLLVMRPDKNSTFVFATLVTATAVAFANPILVGLADFRDSPTAKKMLSLAATSRHDGTLWVSDSASVDALFLAAGTPALSSRQVIGPQVSEWERLDPGDANEITWNRGGTYIQFVWTQEPTLTFSNPYTDVVVISGSPCTVKKDIPQLGYVVSRAPLSAPCLTKVDELAWSGARFTVYRTS